jgi:hypothetical protein
MLNEHTFHYDKNLGVLLRNKYFDRYPIVSVRDKRERIQLPAAIYHDEWYSQVHHDLQDMRVHTRTVRVSC